MSETLDIIENQPMTLLSDLYEDAKKVDGAASLLEIFYLPSSLDGPTYEDALRFLRSSLWDVADDLIRVHKLLSDEYKERMLTEYKEKGLNDGTARRNRDDSPQGTGATLAQG